MEYQEEQSTSPAKGLHHRAIIMTIVLFVLIVIGMFTFAFLQSGEKGIDSVPTTEVEQRAIEDRYASIDRIEGKHFYIDGVHTVVGEIALPTPCDLLESDARVAESFPEQILFSFTVINNADTCPQIVTPQRFKISASASEEATFSATFQNKHVELNLIEATEGETPEDFELFVKG